MEKIRIEYIDKLKGFAIVLVVLGHVMESMHLKSNIFLDFIYSFHMPLFFFLSGFFNNSDINTLHKLNNIIYNKTIRLIIPFIVWIIIFSCYSANNFIEILFHHSKMGYWFLQTLFELIIISECIIYIANLFSYKKRNILILFFILTTQILLLILDKYIDNRYNDLLCIHHLASFWLFFNLGMIFKNVESYTKNLFNDKTIAIIGLIFCILFYINNIYNIILIRLAIKLLATIFFYLTFKNYVLGNTYVQLSSIGKKSLEIYVFHYFLLKNISLFWEKINLCDNSPILLIIILGVSISLAIIYISIIFTDFLSRNKYYSLILFGKSKC